MKLLILEFLLVLPSNVLLFNQGEYKLIFERAETVQYDSSYINRIKTDNFKYNRTQAVVNITVDFKKDIDNTVQLEVQAYKLASNEYRLFPLRFMFNFCEYATKNEFGLGDLFKCGNFTPCSLKKGLHRSCNWAPNGTRFPPHVPEGNYKYDLKFFHQTVEVVFLQIYITLKYPIVKGLPVF